MKRLFTLIIATVLFSFAVFSQTKGVLDSTVTVKFSGTTPEKFLKDHYDDYDTDDNPLHVSKYFWEADGWSDLGEINYGYDVNGNLILYENYKTVEVPEGTLPPDVKEQNSFNAGNDIVEKTEYKNRFEGTAMDVSWVKNMKYDYSYSNDLLDTVYVSTYLRYWQGVKKAGYDYDDYDHLISESVYNWYPEVKVRTYEGLYSENPDASTIYAWTAYRVSQSATMDDLADIVVDSRATVLNVYINNGTDDERYNLHGVGGKTLEDIFNGDNDEKETVDISQLRQDYSEWFKTIENDNLTLIKCNVKAGRAFDVDEVVEINNELYSRSADGPVYENTTYLVKGAATMDDLAQVYLPDDIDWVNVYVQDPDDPNAPVENLHLYGYEGQTLKYLLETENIDLDSLTHKYVEWFEDKDGNKKLVKLNIKGIKQLHGVGTVEVYEKLYNSGQTNDYENTAYDVHDNAVMDDLSAYVIAGDVDWLSVYTNDGTKDIRYNLHGVAGKTLKEALEGSNDEGKSIPLDSLRHDYSEWFTDGSTGRHVLISLNIKAVNDLGPTPMVKETGNLYNYGSSEYKSTAYLVNNAATPDDLKAYTLSDDVVVLNVYVKTNLGLNERYDLHGVAGKTLDVALTADGNDEKIDIDYTTLRDNYREWFKDQSGKLVFVNLNIKAVEIIAPQPVVITDSLFTQSDSKIFSNVAYFVKSYATEDDLAKYVIAKDVEYLDVYYTDANGDKASTSLHGVAGKTLKDALSASGNDEGIDIDISTLRDNYVEWFIDMDKKTKLVKLNLKSVKQKNKGIDNLIQKTEYTYSGDLKATKIVTRYDDDGKPTGIREETDYAYYDSGYLKEEKTYISIDGGPWTGKDKYEYAYNDKGKLKTIAYYEYTGSDYELVTEETYYYSDDTPTFIRKDAAAVSTRVYPNPATDVLNISVKDLNAFEYKVYDMSGTQVLNGYSTNATAIINVSDLDRGIYMVKITSEGKSFTGKFVKK